MASRTDATYGAQWSATLERWVGWLHNGHFTTHFDPRTTRERAMQDARDHMERLYSPQRAEKRWTRS